MAKRKKRVKKKSSNTLTNVAIGLAFVATVLTSVIAGYYMGYTDAEVELVKKQSKTDKKRLAMLKKLEQASTKEKPKDINIRLHDVLKNKQIKEPKDKKKTNKYISASHEIDTKNIPKAPKREEKTTTHKPRLAIIIDDVSVKSHVNAIKSLNIPLTMSFLPPSKYRPNSPDLAAKESFYMVHLPMEAMSFTKEEPFTLRVSDSQQMIQKRVAEIKKLFPKVQYINNHTGSKFTSNELAVNKLIYALDKKGINFIDSRTIASTKVPKVMKNYGKRYVARDVFLDHDMDKAAVKKQIKRAIKVAKTHGTAIAIGHPHVNTILALNESKKLFKDVDLVLVNKLY